ncbi:LlaJI family restriction endonuclease [Mycoplasmopsis caviae]|uniref:LlaJI family restriction endonuclease n=1 Tax=Mycoplasmopsis caviae TaxID=55603 RepID=A0A3P8MF66_9BACT|nr:LlaJI family restriction endonuclease [Mycoplasmopsis caviae]UUD35470.1 LlaJI family restriction endonuclease [Mycoplasmopsis caviae]VDR41753.1 LlaJI restriction endonuclease [Mycoplasmopsis caviae]
MNANSLNFILSEHCSVTDKKSDSFVGVKISQNDFSVHFPIGYQLPDNDDDLMKDIKNLINILTIFNDKNEGTISKGNFNCTTDSSFPFQSYINVINYYLRHNANYYNEIVPVYKIAKKGKIDFKRTIQKVNPVLNNKNIVYLDMVVRNNTQNFDNLITQINKYCVWESFNKIGWLFSISSPVKPDISFDKNMFIMALKIKLNSTNKDVDKQLILSMIAMIEHIANSTNDIEMSFGTNKFEYVWEGLIDTIFGIKNKSKYFPMGIWKDKNNNELCSSVLKPDTIMFYGNKYYVIDAKFYKYGFEPNQGINSLPATTDINKQITYAQNVKSKHPNSEVFNAFLMPYNSHNNIFNANEPYFLVTEAKANWISNPQTYEVIKGIVVDVRYLLKNYQESYNKNKKMLSVEIEKRL